MPIIEKNSHRKKAKRTTLKCLTIAGAAIGTDIIPKKWASPLVEAIILPAHAQTSAALIFVAGNSQLAPRAALSSSATSAIQNFFIQPAVATDLVAIFCNQFYRQCLSLVVNIPGKTVTATLSNGYGQGQAALIGTEFSELEAGHYVINGRFDDAFSKVSGEIYAFSSNNPLCHNWSSGGCTPAPLPPPPSCSDTLFVDFSLDIGQESSRNHQLIIPYEDIEKGVSKTYQLGDAGSHFHDVTLSDIDMSDLRNFQTISIISTSTDGHNHLVYLSCLGIGVVK